MTEFFLQISTALAAGAVVSFKDVGSDAIKSAYNALKNMVFENENSPSDEELKAVPNEKLRDYFMEKVSERLDDFDEAELRTLLGNLKNELASETALKTETVGIDAVGWVRELKLGEVTVGHTNQKGDHKKTVAKLEEGAGSININKLDL